VKPVKVAFFPMHPRDDRATGTFCVLPAERSADRGVAGTVFEPSTPELYGRFYRRKSRGWQLRAALYWYLVVLPRRFFQILRARRYDVIFVQRSMFRWSSPPLVERFARRVTGLPIAYHMDDGIWLAARRKWSEQRCAVATTVVTGNDITAKFAEDAGTPVTKVEYAVDAAAYPVKEHQQRTPVVIGYTGIYPEEHLAPIAEPLRQVCEATGARVMAIGGLRRPEIPAIDAHLDWRAWNNDDVYSWAREFDIGIMPLEDSELHRTKEPLKVKEYMAAALPMVLSPVGYNMQVVSDGEQGFFADSDPEWEERLTRLVADVDLRREMGSNGRRLVLEKYDLSRMLDELAAMFHLLAGRSAAGPQPGGD
jgi:glycosyltransferase involved in cell wall biosynthesis